MKKLCLIVLLASSPCFGQTLANAMMPDGTRDTYIGVALVSQPTSRDDNAVTREAILFPLLQVQWSNGVFMSRFNTVGMHLSDTPGVEYGPLLRWQEGRSPGARRNLAGSAEIKHAPLAGGFFNYYLGHQFRLTSELLSTTAASGILLNLGVQKTLPQIAHHHTVSISVGASAADTAYAMRHYGVTGNTTTIANVSQNYTPMGGLLSVHAGMNWNWALSASWLLSTSASAIHYAPIAADSPVTSIRNAVTVASGLNFRF